MIDLSDWCFRCMVCPRLMHKKNTCKDCDRRDNNNNNNNNKHYSYKCFWNTPRLTAFILNFVLAADIDDDWNKDLEGLYKTKWKTTTTKNRNKSNRYCTSFTWQITYIEGHKLAYFDCFIIFMCRGRWKWHGSRRYLL